VTVSGASGDTVAVVGYSTISTAYTALETAFEATPAGQGVTFTNSFGASGTQAQDVAAGQPADVVNFSLIPDMNTVVKAGLVARSWQKNPTSAAEDGFVADSTVVIVVRPGNPLNITGWNSLTQSGVQIVTPDPISSGSAKWNLLAAYYSQVLQGKTKTEPHNFLNSVITNVVSEPSSGSKALSTFLAGTGNVLLAYESDAQEALAKGSKIQIIYPAPEHLDSDARGVDRHRLEQPRRGSVLPVPLLIGGSDHPHATGLPGDVGWTGEHFEQCVLQSGQVDHDREARRLVEGVGTVLLLDWSLYEDRECPRLHHLIQPR
jgi:ABC-type sulfate transport system substrate-binding protein